MLHHGLAGDRHEPGEVARGRGLRARAVRRSSGGSGRRAPTKTGPASDTGEGARAPHHRRHVEVEPHLAHPEPGDVADAEELEVDARRGVVALGVAPPERQAAAGIGRFDHPDLGVDPDGTARPRIELDVGAQPGTGDDRSQTTSGGGRQLDGPVDGGRVDRNSWVARYSPCRQRGTATSQLQFGRGRTRFCNHAVARTLSPAPASKTRLGRKLLAQRRVMLTGAIDGRSPSGSARSSSCSRPTATATDHAVPPLPRRRGRRRLRDLRHDADAAHATSRPCASGSRRRWRSSSCARAPTGKRSAYRAQPHPACTSRSARCRATRSTSRSRPSSSRACAQLMAELTAQHTGQTVERILADGERDRWFTPEEALEYGMIDDHPSARRSAVSLPRMRSESTMLDTADGPMRLYEAVPDGDVARRVVVIQEAFGVNAHIEDVTRRFADAGYHAVAPDLFHRAGGGTVGVRRLRTRSSSCFGSVIGRRRRPRRRRRRARPPARRPGSPTTSIGIVGFCFGGRVSFLVALERSARRGRRLLRRRHRHRPLPAVPPARRRRRRRCRRRGSACSATKTRRSRSTTSSSCATALGGAPVDTEVVRYADAGHGFHCDVRGRRTTRMRPPTRGRARSTGSPVTSRDAAQSSSFLSRPFPRSGCSP